MPRLRLFLTLLISSVSAFASGWTPMVRVEGKVIQDSNVFLQDDVPLTAGQTVRGEPVRADDQEFLAVAAVGATRKVPTGSATLGYAYEWHRFADYVAESHRDHRLTAGGQWADRGLSAEAKGSYLIVDGSHTSPVYNELGGVPALGGDVVRSRRSQTVLTASGSVGGPLRGAWRWRSVGSLFDQDFQTAQAGTPYGCANYVDRGQGFLGLEVGHPVRAGLTGWLAFRGGQQWQDNLLGKAENFTNRVLRPLAGLEGQVTPTLKVSLWAGPDYRKFTAQRPAYAQANRTIPYFDTTATWTPNKADAVTLGARHQLWFGGGGRSAYRELKLDAAWTHRGPANLEFGTRAGMLHGDFNGFAAGARHETIYNVGTTLARPVAPGLKAELGLTHEWSDTFVTGTEGRAYARWLVSAGVAKTW